MRGVETPGQRENFRACSIHWKSRTGHSWNVAAEALFRAGSLAESAGAWRCIPRPRELASEKEPNFRMGFFERGN